MVPKRSGSSDSSPDSKKRMRNDCGIEANDCIEVFLVSRPEEIDDANSVSMDTVDLNHFFEENGKIYGYKDLKIHIWFSIISFRAYADITYQCKFIGSNATTDLKPVLQSIFGETLVEQKDEFLQTFSTESHYIRTVVPNGEVVNRWEEKGSVVETICMDLRSMPVQELYSRLVPLVLLRIKGGRPIEITDPAGELYFMVERKSDESGEINVKLLGFTFICHVYHYPDCLRLRIGQILVLPPYLHQGHGHHLLETLNSIAVSEDVYDVTSKMPHKYLQYIRASIDTLRLLAFEPIMPTIASVASQLDQGNLSKRTYELHSDIPATASMVEDLRVCIDMLRFLAFEPILNQGNLSKRTYEFHSDPPASMVEDVRKKLKINKKQLLRCWEVLIFLNLSPGDPQCIDNYITLISDRIKVVLFGKIASAAGKRVIEVQSNNGSDKYFVMFRTQPAVEDDNLEDKPDVDEDKKRWLVQMLDNRMAWIMAVAKMISLYSKA